MGLLPRRDARQDIARVAAVLVLHIGPTSWNLRMKLYLVTLGVGLLVGVIYGLLNVRSPAPPVIALVGLLGILAGEQAVPWVRKLLAREPLTVGAVKRDCAAHMFATLPKVEPPVHQERSSPSS